jgi:hypothetical protein
MASVRSRHERDADNSGAARQVQNTGDVFEIQGWRTRDKQHSVGPACENLLQTISQVLPRNGLRIDGDSAVLCDVHNDVAEFR